MSIKEFVATGRRKRAIAGVRLRPGTGNVAINGKKFEECFPLELQRRSILAPLEKMTSPEKYDLIIHVNGGGVEGQVIAARLGIARALVLEDAGRRQDLKILGFLTRDPRKKERKKYGRKKARKGFQFSKR